MSSLRKKLVVGFAVAALGGAVHAANYGESSPYLIGSSGTLISNIALSDSGPFSDTFFFQLTGGTGAQAGIDSLFWGNGLWDVPGLTFKLVGPGFNSILNPSVSLSAGGQLLQAGTSFSGLQKGVNYALTIEGTDTSNLGASYNVQISAVPEPETYAMLLAGIGLLSGVARSRKRTD